MKTLASFLSVLTILLITQSCATPERKLEDSGEKQLTQSELEELFSVDRVARYVAKKGNVVTLTYLPNGYQKLIYQGGSDEGQYRIENGIFCSKWTEIRAGQERCGRFYRISENEYTFVNNNGKQSTKMIFD